MKLNGHRDHGGGIDAAAAQYGGHRGDWLDLSTGINPTPYPLPEIPQQYWSALPDQRAENALCDAARAFWQVPDTLNILAVPGASAAISHIPFLTSLGTVRIRNDTYNEHAASFRNAGWLVSENGTSPTASVVVHPNNPDGRLASFDDLAGSLKVIDESFCDVAPGDSFVRQTLDGGSLILKSFGKFWGLAGLRLGFVIGNATLLDPLAEMLGPWPVSGPAQFAGAVALKDQAWADATRASLRTDAARLDSLLQKAGADIVGGTTLFRLYHVDNARSWQDRLARHRIWTRVFPYNANWLRLGLPAEGGWTRLEQALQ